MVTTTPAYIRKTSAELCKQAINPRLSSKPFRRSLGYNLLELMITTSITACLLALATPSFAHIIDNNRVSSTSQQIFQSLILARSSAINHSKTVLICQLSDSEKDECVKSHKRNINWKHGWLVYIDVNRNGSHDDKDHVLQRLAPDKQTAVIFNQNGRLRFFSDGSSRSAGFYICTAKSNHVKHIKLLYSGRARSVKNTSEKTLEACKKSLI